MSEIRGTKLYHDAMAYDYGDQKRTELMHETWDPVPWIIDVYTGDSRDPELKMKMLAWLKNHLGPENQAYKKQCGQWSMGLATLYGWTWIGFATEEQMQQFQEAWPTPAGAVKR